MITVVDTDALLGIAYAEDGHHVHATNLLEMFVAASAQLILLPTTVCEFSLLATSRIGKTRTKEVTTMLMGGGYSLLSVSEQLTRDAHALYLQQTSKEESLFDCYNMVIAKTFRADCIFSFDRGYIKNGFALAEDFLKKAVA